jgi:serralysin
VAEIGKGPTRHSIRDFTHLVDDIELVTIDANGSAAGNGCFTFLSGEGAAFVAGLRGQLRFDPVNLAGTANDRTLVEGDTNGDRVADFQIRLNGLSC